MPTRRSDSTFGLTVAPVEAERAEWRVESWVRRTRFTAVVTLVALSIALAVLLPGVGAWLGGALMVVAAVWNWLPVEPAAGGSSSRATRARRSPLFGAVRARKCSGSDVACRHRRWVSTRARPGARPARPPRHPCSTIEPGRVGWGDRFGGAVGRVVGFLLTAVGPDDPPPLPGEQRRSVRTTYRREAGDSDQVGEGVVAPRLCPRPHLQGFRYWR